MEQTADFSQPDRKEAQKRARKYNRSKRILGIVNFLIDLVFLLFFLLGGSSLALQGFFEGFLKSPWLVILGYVTVLILLLEIISFPVNFLSGFLLEHHYKLSNQTLKDWLKDKFKGFSVTFLLGLVLAELLYAILRNYPSLWWLLAAFLFSVLFILMAKLFPVLLIPIFFKLTPLKDEDLEKRLFDLSSKTRTRIRDVCKIDLSKKSKTANAALAGLGNTQKIILSDTLLENFSPDEIEVIVAHELGHHVKRHIPRLIAIQSLITLIAFFIADAVFRSTLSFFRFDAVHDIGNLPLLLLVFLFLSLISFPFANAYSRHLERHADEYALSATGAKEAFIASMEKLGLLNLAEIEPHPFIEFVFYSHPSIKKRIAFAKNFSLKGGTIRHD